MRAHKSPRARQRLPRLGHHSIEHLPDVKDAVVDVELTRSAQGLELDIEPHRVITENLLRANLNM